MKRQPTKAEIEAAHEAIDAAIEKSVLPQPAPANTIAEETGYQVTQVARRYPVNGWHWRAGRWRYKHKKDHE